MNMLFFLIGIIVLVFAVVVGTNTATKLSMYGRSIYYFFFAYDAPAEVPPPMTWREEDVHRSNKRDRVRILFIRHGHSTTNSLRVTSDPEWYSFVGQFLHKEIFGIFDRFDSGWLDAAVSNRGLQQAHELRQALNEKVLFNSAYRNEDEATFTFNPNNTALVSSNIRRAMETAAVGLSNVSGPQPPTLSRPQTPGEYKIAIDTSLQEVNTLGFLNEQDYQSLHPIPIRLAKIRATHLGHDIVTTNVRDCEMFSAQFNSGNRNAETNVWKRHDNFIKNLFGFSGCAGAETVEGRRGYTPAANNTTPQQLEQAIVVGHSGWFRRFVLRHLPKDSNHPLGHHLIRNCAAVAFDVVVVKDEYGLSSLRVDESSVKFVHRELGRRD